jgi:hypothetical protein
MAGHGAEQLAALARRQLGLATTEQILGIGISRDGLRRRLAAGTLVRAGKHVYAVAGSPPTWEQRALAACLDRGDHAVLSHLSAAAAWQLDAPSDARIHVTVPHDRASTASRGGVMLHRTRSLAASDAVRVGSIPVTSVARTLVDLATMLRPATLTRVVDDALGRRLVSPDGLRASTDQLAARRRGGCAALREALDVWCGGPALGSVAEARFLRLFSDAGLPAPERQWHAYDSSGLIGRLDFAWPDNMLVLEIDGFRYHANPRSYAVDRERTNRLVATGRTVLRATPTEIETAPHAVIATLRRCLAASGRRAGLRGAPSGAGARAE